VGLKQDKKTGVWSHTAEQLIARAKELKADGVDLSACDAITPAFGQAIKDAGLKLLVWTVNDPAVARQMLAAGVQGITTDRPAWLRENVPWPWLRIPAVPSVNRRLSVAVSA
ncbi:MAG TPA: glycerophosphodiester phosphodiesterase family protein, partial [bacterium]|nr:glycerophosphodiester phosphodiesterase family protein [bacterium]